MDLLTAFKDFSATHRLFASGDHLLLAVSGGVDSVVLCELCRQAGLDFTIAHCNFQLRGAESDRDETLVRQTAARYNKQVVVKRFDTQQVAADRKLSIQVAARELRYEWFHTLASRLITTAHHLDDNVETLLMNFFKGTGIAGLRAMLPQQGAIIHPLLFATKTQLQQFALDHNLAWSEDSSNLTDKYTRNYFRHQLIPLVQDRFPEALHNLGANIDRFREIEMIYRQAIGWQKKKLYEYDGDEVHIPALKLKRSTPLHSIVYEIISDFGFSPQQTGAAIDLLDSSSGKYICSATHRILKDRNWLIISPLPTSTTAAHILIESDGARIQYDQHTLHLATLPASRVPAHVIPSTALAPTPPSDRRRPGDHKKRLPAGGIPISAGSKPANIKSATAEPIAWLDAAHIEFPLLLRKWQPGDYFYPLGLRKKKKLARFFIDNKLSLADKEKIWVLEMDKKIVWVIGLRIDDRFRITPQTKQVLRIESAIAPNSSGDASIR